MELFDGPISQSESADSVEHGEKLLVNLQNDVPQPDNTPETELDLCAQKLKLSVARFRDSAKRKVEETEISNLKLQKKIEENDKRLQQYELMLQKELQQGQQYEQMLQMERQQRQEIDMKLRVLDGFKKYLKGAIRLLAMFRERIQLAEEPLYVPHPDGGGNVILVSEWKKLEDVRQKMAIKAMIEKMEEVMMKTMKEQLSALETYCHRLEDLEQTVRTMRGRF